MASIRKIEGKGGVSYKITASMGRDAQDKQIRHFKTWKPDKPRRARYPAGKPAKTTLLIWTPWRHIWPVEVPPMLIADLLSHGAENGVTLHHLENLTGWDGHTVRRQIEAERRRGTPILADCKNGCGH